MAGVFLNINSDAVVKFTNTLEQLHKSALPVAIRQTLNDAAYDVKKNTMPKEASRDFVKRTSGDFFKANSRVEGATGFDVYHMIAKVGFVEAGLKGTNNFAVKDLEQQEEGGEIGGRSFKPLAGARRGNTMGGDVRPNLRISIVRNMLRRTSQTRGANWAQKAIITSIYAGVGGYVLDDHKSASLIWRVDAISRIGRNTRIKRTDLYTFNKNGKAKIKTKTHFMKKASLESGGKIERMYSVRAKAKIAQYYAKKYAA